MRRALAVLAVLLAVATSQGARAGTCATIACGVPVAVTIGVVGEVDCYEFSATAGEVVSIAESEPTQAKFNTCWVLRRPDNATVGTPECSGQRNVTLPIGGTYTIEVYDNSDAGFGDATGSYDLTYTVVSDSPASCAAAVACGDTLGGSIAVPTESDTYEFSAQAGEVASLTVNEATPGIVAGFELYGPTGTSLAKATAQRTVQLPDTGVYTIRAFENGEDETGLYDLDFTIVSATASSCASAIACGENPTPTISPRTDSDTFELTTSLAAEGVRVITTGAGGVFSPCWTIYQAPGPGPTPAGTPTPVCGQADALLANAGTHIIRVADANDDATGPYGLGLQCLGTATPTLTPTPTLSATPTLTPTATSETPTPTLTPDPTVTATAVVTPSATLAPNATPTPIGPPAGLADPAAAKAAVRCQKTLASASAKLVVARLKRLDACASRVLGCVETKPGDTSCRDKAAIACDRGLAKLAADGTRMRAAIVKGCGGLAAGDRGTAAGLGFDTQAMVCGGLGSPVGDVDGLAGCVGARSACRADALMTIGGPRAGEMLRLAGVTLPPGACLADFGGAGAGGGDPDTGKAVLQCAKTLTRAARTLAAARLARTASCVQAVFACVQLHPGDATCLGKAALRCGSEAGKIAAAEAKFAAAANQRCPAIPFATLAAASGLDLAALDTTCTALQAGPVSSLAAYQECLLRSHACDTARVLAAAAPRAGEMLAQVQRALLESFCPVP